MILGQDRTIHALDNLINTQRLPHGLLLSGPEGVGKRMIALLLAESLLMPQSKRDALASLNQLPVGARRVLSEDNSLVATGTHPDLFFLKRADEKRDIPVESVRELIGHLSLKSYRGGAKVAIIDDAHRLSNAGANALLMTLEEPPANTYLVLCSHAEHRLPATILSRLQKLTCASLSDEIIHQLLTHCVDTPRHQLTDLITLCDGALGILELSRFRDPLTSAFVQKDDLAEHLEQVEKQLLEWEKLLSQLSDSPSAADALRLATIVNKGELGAELFFGFLRNRMRRQLRRCGNAAQTRVIASKLLELLNAERGITERNLSTELQLSCFFT